MKTSTTSSRFTFKPVLYHASMLLLATTLGVATVGVSFAAPEGEGKAVTEGRAFNPADRMARHLSLDDSQKASVAAIFERNKPANAALRARSKTHHEAMKALDPKSRDYSTRATALADEAGTLERDRVLQRTQLNAELATVLNAEQLTKMSQHKGRGHRGGRHHRGGEHKGPKPADAPKNPS